MFARRYILETRDDVAAGTRLVEIGTGFCYVAVTPNLRASLLEGEDREIVLDALRELLATVEEHEIPAERATE